MPGQHGWLALAGDPDAFARSMLEAADMGPADRQRMARLNRSVAEERADWDRNFDLLLDAYSRVEAGDVS